MDNNTPKGDNEKKPFHKKYNHHRRRSQGASQPEGSDNSPGGQVIVRGGRYDLPPSADELESAKPEIKAANTTESSEAKPVHKENTKGKDSGKSGTPAKSSDNKSAEAAPKSESGADSPSGEERENRRSRRPRPNHSRKTQEPQTDGISELAAEDAKSASEDGSGDKTSDRQKSRRPRAGRRKSHQGDRLLNEKDARLLDELANAELDGDGYEAESGDESSKYSDGAVNDSSTAAEPTAVISEVTLTANADPNAPGDGEIIEELNSSDTPDDAPGVEQTDVEAVQPDKAEAPVATLEIIGVKFKATGKIYYFDPSGFRFRRMDKVVVDTARGLEYGIVELGNRMVTEREVVLPLRKVVRRATEDDIARAEANAARAAEALAICGEKIIEHKLDMKLVDVEYTFDNSKLLFYFTADGRVDFRELVKDLASVFRTRIELRQIGIRDETKLLGGIGICGRPFCCKTFLSDFVQVSIKMAKEQSLSLNSAKISGACGRLMCCLRYEYDTYAEEIRKTPKVDQIVETPDGEGLVIEVQPLAGLVRVKFTTQELPPKVFHRDDVTVTGGKGVKNKPANS